jgi:hypothetical protein
VAQDATSRGDRGFHKSGVFATQPFKAGVADIDVHGVSSQSPDDPLLRGGARLG